MRSILGSNTSVHTGSFNTDFTSLIAKDPEHMPKYTGTGAAASMLSNRLSWFYDLKGPSMTIDTACSSSMVALDLACSALQNGTSNMASRHHRPTVLLEVSWLTIELLGYSCRLQSHLQH